MTRQHLERACVSKDHVEQRVIAVIKTAAKEYPKDGHHYHQLDLESLWPTLPQPAFSYVAVQRKGLEHRCIDGAHAFAVGGCALSTICPDSAAAPTTGFALLGELDKFVPISADRIVAVELQPETARAARLAAGRFGNNQGSQMIVEVPGAVGEVVKLYAVDSWCFYIGRPAQIEGGGSWSGAAYSVCL